MAVIYIMINLYVITALQSHMHVALRAVAGGMTGLTVSGVEDGQERDKYRRAAESRAPSIESHKDVLRPYISAEFESVYKANSIVSKAARRKSAGRVYIIDEVKNIRAAGILMDMSGVT
jgi:hypothetical protein